ncbi:hypothetical protein [Actinoplanes couchii]|uniref:hypothetical protein n=1 Tax=Actinoplanes couchii TaxID=403638 RepID=UPI00403A2F6B
MSGDRISGDRISGDRASGGRGVSGGRKAPAGWEVLGGGLAAGRGSLTERRASGWDGAGGKAAGRGLSAGGGTSLMLGLIAAASRGGAWCAVVGVPQLGVLAAAESGVVLERLALVPEPGPDWATVVASLIDGVDLVVVAVPGPVPTGIVSRLAARARQRGSVLVPFGDWAGADVTLAVDGGRWEGLGAGRGRLRRREVTVLARGRGAAARPREITTWMPGVAIRQEPVPPRPEDPAPRRRSPAAEERPVAAETPAAGLAVVPSGQVGAEIGARVVAGGAGEKARAGDGTRGRDRTVTEVG